MHGGGQGFESPRSSLTTDKPTADRLKLRELVAEAAHGLNVARVLGIGLYLLADVLDMYVGGAGLAEKVTAAAEVAHDLLSAIHPSRVGGQKRQNFELSGRKLHGLP